MQRVDGMVEVEVGEDRNGTGWRIGVVEGNRREAASRRKRRCCGISMPAIQGRERARRSEGMYV